MNAKVQTSETTCQQGVVRNIVIICSAGLLHTFVAPCAISPLCPAVSLPPCQLSELVLDACISMSNLLSITPIDSAAHGEGLEEVQQGRQWRHALFCSSEFRRRGDAGMRRARRGRGSQGVRYAHENWVDTSSCPLPHHHRLRRSDRECEASGVHPAQAAEMFRTKYTVMS